MTAPDLTLQDAAAGVVFHGEPVLKTVTPDSDRPWEIDEVWDPAASYQCAMRHNTEHNGTVGWREHEYSDTYGTDHITQEWVPFYAVQLPGETEPQRFCEDDARWITTAAEYLLAEDSA